MLAKKTWVLVANGAKARIFNFSKGSLTELTVFVHPETRMHGHDLVTDRPGPSMEPHIQPQKNEAQHFAKDVSRYLDLKHRMNQFEHLHLIASPAFLGLLRRDLHKETRKSILTELDKDLVEENPHHIQNYL